MTNSFILISAAIVLAAIGLLAPFLLRRQRISAESRGQYNVQVARDRLRELQAEQERGELSDEEFAQARQDLDIALAQDLSVPSRDSALDDPGRTGPLTLAALLVLVPAIVGFTYLKTGNPGALGVVGPGTPAAQTAGGHERMPPISELVKKLEAHLEQDPDNIDGWFLLGRTYMKLSRYPDAVRAFRRLNQLQPDNDAIQISLADALSMQNQGRVPDEAISLLEQIDRRDPRNSTVLWLLGNASAQQGRDREALDYWVRAYPLLSGDPQMQAELGDAIRQIESRSGLSADIAQPAALPSIMGGAPAATPASDEPVADTAGPGISVEVALDPELMDQAAPGDTVFVYAKAAAGPPMPLAVARGRVSELPLRVRLSDEMAMTPQMKLSGFPEVRVGARISKSGQAIARSGDLQSPEVETSSDSDQTIQLLIDSRRP